MTLSQESSPTTSVWSAFDATATSLYGPLGDPARDAGHDAGHPKRVGFFTDTSICIGCKACEVACKEWNLIDGDGTDGTGNYNLLGMSYDNTGDLNATTWRHVAFIEDVRPHGSSTAAHQGLDSLTGQTTGHLPDGLPAMSAPSLAPATGPVTRPPASPYPPDTTTDLLTLLPDSGAHGQQTPDDGRDVRWLMASDVCKHCTHAGCLDVCPTGALFRTEFGTVVVQDDICNGCGYCVPACPFGVIDVEEKTGGAHKCTL